MITLAKKAVLGFREIPVEFGRLLTKRYPAFVTQGACSPLRDEVPVFMFHTVQEGVFSKQLEYLKKNGYKTLTLNTFTRFLKGECAPEHPSVLLTFDDGDKSWYDVAYPLLEKHGFHAIGFVVPAFIRDAPPEGENRRWLSWSELSEMDQSGVMDIQSHTYGHQRVFIRPTLVDFFHPKFGRDGLGLDIPWVQENGRENRLEWGMPIYQMAPLMAGEPPLTGLEEIQKTCTSWVESHGGKAFFDQPDWKKKLTAHHQSAFERHAVNMIPVSQQVQREYILDDLTRSKKILEDKLHKPIYSLCYPWGAGSELALQVSKEAGYTSNFWVTVHCRRSNKPGDSPFFIPRLKDDYLFRLPGQGRKSLLEIFKMKLRRRVKKLDIYS